MRNKILYVEEGTTGHSLVFAKEIMDAFMQLGCDADLLSGKPNKNAGEFADLFSSMPSSTEVRCLIEDYRKKSLLPYPISTWFRISKALKYVCKSNQYSVIIIANASALFRALAFFLGPFALPKIIYLMISSRFHLFELGVIDRRSLKDIVDKWLFKRFIKRTKALLYTIDPYLAGYVENVLGVKGRVKYVPLPPMGLSFKRDKYQNLNYCEAKYGKIRILVYGAIGNRKAFDTLIKAALCPVLVNKIEIYLVGLQSDESKKTLKFLSKDVIDSGLVINIIERYVSEREAAFYYKSSDIVWVAYRMFYDTSGVLTTAYAHGKPVIGCIEGHIGASIASNCTGLIINPDSVEMARHAITILLDNPELRERLGARGRSVVESMNSHDILLSFAKEVLSQMST